MNKDKIMTDYPQLEQVINLTPTLWLNPNYREQRTNKSTIDFNDILDAEKRLKRFAPFIMEAFPETKDANGIIESELRAIPAMQDYIKQNYNSDFSGKLYLKMDSHLPIAGSVKARGGIYEVLKHTEELALEHGLLTKEDNYNQLNTEKAKEFFSNYKIQVGSTGNLGLSIGIISAKIGYQVIVHMSSDAKQWKKDLLRTKGVKVIEYEDDYNAAVANGRKESDADEYSYFIDDENSIDLFLGYAVAALRLKKQLEEKNVTVDSANPLFVYIPCGVGGAPGGISYGLKEVFGDDVHCFFVEPCPAPAMLVGMATGKHNAIDVKDIGLSGLTIADGLAVSRPSKLVGKLMESRLSGIFTADDNNLENYLKALLKTENIFIEPSAAASFAGIINKNNYAKLQNYLEKQQLINKIKNATHIAWATGGKLVPAEIKADLSN